MRVLLLTAALLATHAPAEAAPEWRQAREYEVLLSSFDIQPGTMEFRAGEPLRLRLINNSTIPHSFSAGDFFRAGDVRPRERKLVSGGTVQVGAGETREILIVPKAGEYSARCSNLFHRVMGMSAKIRVR
jgi:uncharacterized cupredoxin-like copper-binding protein